MDDNLRRDIEQCILDYENQIHNVDNTEEALLCRDLLEKSIALLTECVTGKSTWHWLNIIYIK